MLELFRFNLTRRANFNLLPISSLPIGVKLVFTYLLKYIFNYTFVSSRTWFRLKFFFMNTFNKKCKQCVKHCWCVFKNSYTRFVINMFLVNHKFLFKLFNVHTYSQSKPSMPTILVIICMTKLKLWHCDVCMHMTHYY